MPSQYPPHGRGRRPVKCRECGARRDDGHWISRRGLCEDCGAQRMTDQVQQLHSHAGPMFDSWRGGMREWIDELDAANG